MCEEQNDYLLPKDFISAVLVPKALIFSSSVMRETASLTRSFTLNVGSQKGMDLKGSSRHGLLR